MIVTQQRFSRDEIRAHMSLVHVDIMRRPYVWYGKFSCSSHRQQQVAQPKPKSLNSPLDWWQDECELYPGLGKCLVF